jgi:hypothetical protein
MLKKMAEVIGDKVKLPEELLADGEMTEAKPLEEEKEALDAKDLASAHYNRSRPWLARLEPTIRLDPPTHSQRTASRCCDPRLVPS